VKLIRPVVAILMLLLGLVWIGQGAGLLGGSAMSGQTVWAVIGVVLVVGAAWLVWSGRRTVPG
jgi:hypothetical protein